jgi:hypothetical protein
MLLAYGIRHSTVSILPSTAEMWSPETQVAPIINDVKIQYSLVRFNGSLLKSNIFRQDFGDEVDAAWKSLGADCTCRLMEIQDPILTTF